MKKVTYKNMIYVPKDLRTKVMKWFHHYLYYPEEARMHKTLTSTYYRKKMDDEIRQFLKQCPACQRFKKEKKKKKYNKIPPKNVELIPWDTVCSINLVGHYTVTDQKGNDRILNVIINYGPSHRLV